MNDNSNVPPKSMSNKKEKLIELLKELENKGLELLNILNINETIMAGGRNNKEQEAIIEKILT